MLNISVKNKYTQHIIRLLKTLCQIQTRCDNEEIDEEKKKLSSNPNNKTSAASC